jgi:hypothetical protein
MIHNGNDMLRLWKFCEKFIKKNDINCPETIYQSDGVAEVSPEFIEGVCNIVGYYDEEHDKFSKPKGY